MEGNDFTAHLTLGAVAVYAIEHAKSSGLVPWMTADTKTLNRLVNLITAFITSIGIGYTYDATAGTLVVSGLTLSSLALGLWELTKQYVVQQVLYDTVIQRRVVNRPAESPAPHPVG